MKLFKKYLLILILVFMFNIIVDVKADDESLSGGEQSGGGEFSSSNGSWCWKCVGLKVTIKTSTDSNTLIYYNQTIDDIKTNLKIHSNILTSKIDYGEKSSTNEWKNFDSNNNYKKINFGFDSWLNVADGNQNIDLEKKLYNNGPTDLLKSLIPETYKTNPEAYLIIEPMTVINAHFGTAYELILGYNDTSTACTWTDENGKQIPVNFQGCYANKVFEGNINNQGGGLFYKTIYFDIGKDDKFNNTDYINIFNKNIYEFDNSKYEERVTCFKKGNCGRGLGVYKIGEVFPQDKPTTFNKYIKKTNEQNVGLYNKNLTLKIFPNENCSGDGRNIDVSTGGSGLITITVDKDQVYSVKEITAPSGYELNNNCFVLSNTPETSNTIVNQSTCNTRVSADNSIKNRMNLFRDSFNTFNKLLDFRENTNLCSSANFTYKSDEDCLYSSQINTIKSGNTNVYFNEYNLSAYNEEMEITKTDGTKTKGYCLTTFSFNSNVNFPTSSVEAGRMVISNNGKIGSGKLIKTCYVEDDNIIRNDFDDKKTYTDYINNVSLGGKNLVSSNNRNNKIRMKFDSVTNNGLIKFIGIVIIDYEFKPVYVYKISGKLCNNSSPQCIYLGKGILSEFQDVKNNKTTKNLNFSIDSSFSGFDFKNNKNCTYNIKERLIKYPPDSPGKLNLEFRIIDTTVPFPDRNPKSNWSNPDDVTNKIINAVNSYGITPTSTGNTPKYSIRLTPDDIRIIRNYNKYVNYDDYRYVTYQVRNNSITENAFIYCLKENGGNGVLRIYNDNKLHDAEKPIGTLSHPLIIN